MKIGVIADTHDRLPALEKALAALRRRKVEALLHAGDYVAPFAAKLLIGDGSPVADGVPLHGIFGNNDGEREGLSNVLPQLQDGPWRGKLGGRNIVMHHWIEWFAPDDLDNADVVIYGHNHEVRNEIDHGVLYLNPGECCGWLHGRCTVAVLDTETLSAEIIAIEP